MESKNTAILNPPMQRLINKLHLNAKHLQILDGGCGNGSISLWLAQYGNNVVAVDYINRWNESEVKNSLVSGSLTFIKADLRRACFSQKFDIITLFGVLHYLDDSDDLSCLLKRLDCWLNPLGTVALTWITNEIALIGRDAYLPSKHEVFSIMNKLKYLNTHLEEVVINHQHDDEIRHSHHIAYSIWDKALK